VPWRDLPDRYGPRETVYKRFARWQTDGTWARTEAALHVQAEGVGELDWDARIDSGLVRAHQHAAGAQRGLPPIQGSRQQALGRSRGGLTTQAPHHLRRPRPEPGYSADPGQDADTLQLVELVDAMRVARPSGRGRPRTRVAHLTGDKATAAGQTGRRGGVPGAAGRWPLTGSAIAPAIRWSG
jgi:Putative transposase of IS4/5 family (DUF4096)